jgi:8-oxo-dGTP diphosphatase
MGVPKTPALATGCVVIDARKRLLLIRRRHPPFRGGYALPGGFADVGEAVEDACRRELMEATAGGRPAGSAQATATGECCNG